MTVVPQHMQALAHANEVRSKVATAKQQIRALPTREGAELCADVVEHDWADDAIGRVRIDHLLMCVHRLGLSATGRCLRTAGVSNPMRRLGELTPRQRAAVAAQLRVWALGYREHRR